MATKTRKKSTVVDVAVTPEESKPVKPRGIKKGEPNPWSPIIRDNGLDQDPGDNTRYASIIMEFMSWGPVNKNDLGELEARLARYLRYCQYNDLRITNQACYMAIGITKDDVYDWEHGRGRYLDPRYSDFIKKVKQICATSREVMMSDGKLNPITGIWWQKQYEGMREQTELTIAPAQPLGPDPDAAQLAADYAKALPSADYPPTLTDAKEV